MKTTPQEDWKEKVTNQYLRRDLNELLNTVEEIRTQAHTRGREEREAEVREEKKVRIAEYPDAGAMFILKSENGKTYEASMPIPKWKEVGPLAFRQTLTQESNNDKKV